MKKLRNDATDSIRGLSRRDITRRLCCIFAAALLAGSACGCGVFRGAGTDGSEIPGNGRDYRAEIEALKDAGEKENRLDAYAASLNVSLSMDAPGESAAGRRESFFLGASAAYCFGRQNGAGDSWSKLACAMGTGEKVQELLDQEAWSAVRDVGAVYGSDHYLTIETRYLESEEDPQLFFAERDEKNNKLREIPLELPETADADGMLRSIRYFAMDGLGRLHLIRATEDGWLYWILSEEGELLAEDTVNKEDILGLASVNDSDIAFWTGSETEWEIWKRGEDSAIESELRYLDPETGRQEKLGALQEGVYCWSLLDENRMLYADREGVFLRDISEADPEPLYLWLNHRIAVEEVYDLQAEGTDEIRLLYKDGEDGCVHYLSLEPSEGEPDVCEITIAISPARNDLLVQAVMRFNREYPGCHIKIRNDYEETALLTELTAGKGPVLVDTELTGFADQKELWEQLDPFVKQMGFTEVLWPAVQEAGKIDGAFYGIPMTCNMWTLGTLDPDIEDWNYDTFLQLIEQAAESRPGFEGVFNSYEGYGTRFILDFFIHSVEDSYFWDIEKGTTDFDSEKFRSLLKIAKEYVEDKGNIGYDRDKLIEGKLFCYEFQFYKANLYIMEKATFDGKMRYIGYPTRSGAVNDLWVNDLLAVRKTASDEEKLIALAFLDFCVSHDLQKSITRETDVANMAMSVRKDLLEEQIADLKESLKEFTQSVIIDGRDVPILDYTDPEQDSREIMELFENAEPRGGLPGELRKILEGELEQYFSGAITEDMLIDHLENRVGLYLDERK